MEHNSVLRSNATNNASAVMSDRFEKKTKQKKKKMKRQKTVMYQILRHNDEFKTKY